MIKYHLVFALVIILSLSACTAPTSTDATAEGGQGVPATYTLRPTYTPTPVLPSTDTPVPASGPAEEETQTPIPTASMAPSSTPSSAQDREGEISTSEPPGTGALDAVGQLALGTIYLEETEIAITPQQVVSLLPIWQAIQSAVTQEYTQVDEVLAQVELAMSPSQLGAIAAMGLTQQDLWTWMQEQGLGMPTFPGGQMSPEQRATRMPSDSSGEGQRPSPEQMATQQAQRGDQGQSPNGRAPR